MVISVGHLEVTPLVQCFCTVPIQLCLMTFVQESCKALYSSSVVGFGYNDICMEQSVSTFSISVWHVLTE